MNVLLVFAFVVAVIVLGAKIAYPSGTSLHYRFFDGFYWLAASYIPAYIMFLLVAELPRIQDLKNIRPFLANQTAMLVGDGQAVVEELQKAAGYEGPDSLTKEDFVEICKRINPSGPAPLLRHSQSLERATWIEFLVDRRRRSGRAIEKLFRYMTFLDSEHVRIITNIDDSTLFLMLDLISGRSASNTDLTFLAEPLFGYYGLIRQLQQYADRHLKGLAWSERRD